MFYSGLLCHCLGMKEKVKISKENQGDKLIVTFAGDKKDIASLDKKIDAAHVLMSECCEAKMDGKPCC